MSLNSENLDPVFTIHNQDGQLVSEIKILSDKDKNPLDSLIKSVRELQKQSNALLTTMVEKDLEKLNEDSISNEDLMKNNKRQKEVEKSNKKLKTKL